MNFIVTRSSGTLSILCSALTCSIHKTEVSDLMTSIKQEMGFWILTYIELESLNKELFQMDHLGCVRVFGESMDFTDFINDHNAFLLFNLVD